MTAALKFIQDLTAAGVTISREGDTIVLDGPEEALPDTMVAIIRELKPQIMACLGNTVAYWTQDAWTKFFAERVNFAGENSGYDSRSSELCAFEDCVDQWLLLNPPPSVAALECIQCGKALLSAEPDVIPVISGSASNSLHQACAAKWLGSRRREARKSLLWLFNNQGGNQPN